MKRHSASEIFPLIEAYRSGALTREEFCRQTNLKEGSLSYWLQRYRKATKRESAFVRLTTPMETSHDYCMEIMMSNGKRIRFTSLVPVEYIESILKIG